MFVRPASGALVRDPHTKRALPQSGREVPESVYWLRRLRCGDVVLSTPDVIPHIQIPDSTPEEQP